jgi:FMN reductase
LYLDYGLIGQDSQTSRRPHRRRVDGADGSRTVTEITAPHRVTVLLGNPRPGSRTRRVALHATATVVECLAARGLPVNEPAVVDLAELTPALSTADPVQPPSLVTDALDLVSAAGLLVVATPTFKGTYTGLLKLFVDLLPRAALHRSVAVPVMTAARTADQHAIDSYLRPLLVTLGATVPVPGLSVLEAQFDRLPDVVGQWCLGAVPVLAAVLANMADPGLALLPDPALLTWV